MKLTNVIRTIGAALAVTLVVQISAALPGKKPAARISYVFPEAMLPAVRLEFSKQCDKGQALYMLACASCHNRELKGRIIVPDWPAEKLVGYELRVLNSAHESGLPDEHVTAEELGDIMMFLTYKKRNS